MADLILHLAPDTAIGQSGHLVEDTDDAIDGLLNVGGAELG